MREDRVQIDNRPKAPDYSFRIGGYRKFFVEAKKPSVNIHDDIAPAFQIRRYGYTAKLPLSILTDFEEFAVYDTRIKPGGMLGMITPSNYFSNNGIISLRRKILNETFIVELNNIHGKVFSGSVDTALTILAKEKSKKKMKFVDSTWVSKEQCLVQINERKFYQSKLQSSDDLLFTFQSDVLEIRCKTFLLGDRYNVNFGMQLRDRQLYPQDVISIEQRKLKTKFHKPCYTGKNVQKWHLDDNGLLAYFNREAQSGGCWDEKIHFANPKIIIRQIGAVPICTLDQNGYCCLNTVFMVVPKTSETLSEELLYLLAILNSKFIGYYWKTHFSDQQRTREQRVLILDREIDTLVYELYNLDSSEIKIVEGE